MQFFLFTIVFSITFASYSKEIKLKKSAHYYKSIQDTAIKKNVKPFPLQKKINNINPIFVPKKPVLNGNFSQQLTYKNSQQKIITRPENQSTPN
jgi:hypothetical protein